ncbi:TIGR03766 family XrtG-associated glycosyltransferase [Liquorilactobacillus ghanensis]|uniref:TIGR03766 family XrtG-associated glycosyltransferase n=1 Tax=Liquorilactobacillus ghanensis TaxID=399370 RepID=UPI0039E7F546
MHKRLNVSIFYLFYFLFILTFGFAITSPNLILGDNRVTGSGTTYFTTGMLIISGGIIISLLVFTGFRNTFKRIFWQKRAVTSKLLLFVVIICQITFVFMVHPPIGFDAGAIHKALMDHNSVNIRSYFSQYYNNLPILLVQRQLAKLFATSTWLFFDLITLFLVDLAALFNILTIKVIDCTKTAIAVYLQAAWLIVFPMIIVPYTDTWVLPLVSGYLLGYSLVFYGKQAAVGKLLGAVLLGGCLAAAYFIKPSAVIGGIAMLLIELIHLTVKNSIVKIIHHKSQLIAILLLMFSLVGSYYWLQQTIEQQRYIKTDPNRAVPAIHFISMGVSGTGGYNAKDALAMAQIPTKAGRIDYSKKILWQRLRQKGMLGYAWFLIQKQRNNTADGTFSWVKEGHFFADGTKPQARGLTGQLKQFIYLYGTRLGDFRFLAQVWWCVVLWLIVWGWQDRSRFTQMLRLAIIGGFLYLLIFEGGRSRYLIQFLPYFLTLAAVVSPISWKNWHFVYRWLSGKKIA